MATQQDLSDFIKKVHIDLRLTSREVGVKAAWEEHCKNDYVLKKYAETMRNLATVYWDKNIEQNINRINWVVKECDNYFSQKKQKEIFEKEQKMSFRYFGDTVKCEDYIFPQTEVLELLDVGSCYNPFKQFEQFNVTAIDLAPATQDVLRCDFLNVILEDYVLIQENSVISLPRQYFDIVVFSLLLEYLPHPSLRYDCCLKAYELLRPGGALLIITPDSKHPSANSQLIKNWRMALAHLGFIKVSYEKTEHLHCMTYTKCIDARLPKKWLSLQRIENDPETLMIIPQDNVQYKTGQRNEEHLERCESDNKIIVDNFSVLAGDCLF